MYERSMYIRQVALHTDTTPRDQRANNAMRTIGTLTNFFSHLKRQEIQ